MSSILNDCMCRIREKTTFYLIEGFNHLLYGSKYPFDKYLLPVMGELTHGLKKGFEAFQSCNRSITFPLDSVWFKAKGIGIPCGASQPIIVQDKIYTYKLIDDHHLGFDTVIWGFHTDPKKEFEGMKKIFNKGLPSPTPIGWAKYKNLFVFDVLNRTHLFNLLKNKQELLNKVRNKSKKDNGGCIYCIEKSDIRVDEVLCAFSYPFIHKIIDIKECSTYIKWLGYSCAYNLRLHHDQGFLHGSRKRISGLLKGKYMTNSYVGNHTIGEKDTQMTDYDMVCKINNNYEKKFEVNCIINLMNPLFPKYNNGRPLNLKKPAQEKFASSFKEGVKLGYNKNIFDIESNLKRDFLIISTKINEKTWINLDLPKTYIRSRGVDFYLKLLSNNLYRKKIKKILNELNDVYL